MAHPHKGTILGIGLNIYQSKSRSSEKNIYQIVYLVLLNSVDEMLLRAVDLIYSFVVVQIK